MKRILRRLLVSLLVLGVIVGAGGGAAAWWAYRRYVVEEPGEHVSHEYVMGVIAQESPVFYRDGRTRLGVFFADEHRAYVPWEQLPRSWIAAVVAAEDDSFWSHRGIDPVHVARAVLGNLQAGHVTSGGSTLTQQTAKNLYYRPDRSLRSKLDEALNALRLEAHFDKTEILTLYANQFHVSGNGRGLGIAARHFFDVDPEHLTVLQSAFLAGLVKAPSHYDPFLGDEAQRAAAVKRAVARTRYVLQRIVAEPATKLAGPEPLPGDAASQQAYRARVEEVEGIRKEAARLLADGFELPFKRGVFRYESNAVLDEIARRLSEPPFDEVLRTAGIEDPKTAGLEVVTTLDPDAQRVAVYGLWHHLTEVGVMLEKLGADAFVLKDSPGPRYDPDVPPKQGEFRLGRVTAVEGGDGKVHATVDLGGTACAVDRAALQRVATAVRRGEAGSAGAKATSAQVDAFGRALKAGDVVWASVREIGEAGHVCDLEVRPELQGAAMVLREGEILAMVGGSDNRNFNRATALRQMGSTWKPLVYHAAIELGWNPDDLLDNRRQLFPYSTTSYWPSPDHAGEDEISLAWAGARSENVASVWLLYHLTDRLDEERVAELATALGLARGEGESLEDYRLRIQKAGVLPTPGRMDESLYLLARQEIVASMVGGPYEADARALQSLLYGYGFDSQAAGAAWQQAALGRSWKAAEAARLRCGEAYRRVVALLELDQIPVDADGLSFAKEGDVVKVACGTKPNGYGALTPELLAKDGLFQPRPQLVPEAELLVGELHAATIDALASAIERRRATRDLAAEGGLDLYDPSILYAQQDFRVLLGLTYVTRLAEQFGVRTELQKVLSLPLGASEITLEELTKVYEGLVTGKSWTFPGVAVGALGEREVGEPLASALLIQEIRDVDGHVLYRAKPTQVEVTSTDTAAMTADVLRHVVARGTGERAKGAVTLRGAPLPIGGKTGTTNDYRNVAFVGFVPSVEPERGPVLVGVYTGYDDNREMKRGGIKLAGASGALPAWTTIARGVAAAGLVGSPEGAAPPEGWPVVDPETLVRRTVDAVRGLPAEGEELPTVLTRPAAAPPAEAGELALLEPHEPRVRVAHRTEDVRRFVEDLQQRMEQGNGRGVWGRRRRDRQPDDEASP